MTGRGGARQKTGPRASTRSEISYEPAASEQQQLTSEGKKEKCTIREDLPLGKRGDKCLLL